MSFRQFAVAVERLWEAVRSRRSRSRVPAHFRIEPYLGHGGPAGVVVRGRVLDNPPETEAEEGEGMVAAALRTVRDFLTHELPGVPLEVTVAGASAETVTDAEGYFLVRVPVEPRALMSPWTHGTVVLAGEYRGITGSRGEVPTIASPVHKQVFSLEDGRCLDAMDKAPRPGRGPDLATYVVSVDHGRVTLDLPAA